MIFDFFKNAGKYSHIPYIEEVRKYVSGRNGLLIPEGEHEILGRELFVRVAEYQTGAKDEKPFEAHQLYADLQLVLMGEEEMGCSLETPKAATPYNKEADICFFELPVQISSLLVSAGQFAFFFPGELHRPGCHPGTVSSRVKKLVFKIKINQF